MADTQRALKRMQECAARWYAQDAILLHVWTLIEKVPSKTQATFGIDSRSRPAVIKYNPNFINALNDKQLELIMISNAFKIMLKHPTNRIRNPKKISSLSSDVTVDEMLLKNALIDAKIKGIMPIASKFNLPDRSFFEDYFRKIKEQMEEEDLDEKIFEEYGTPNHPIDDIFNQSQNQPGQPGQNQPGQGQGDQESDDPSNSPGSSGQESQEDGKDEDGYPTFKDDTDALNEYYNPLGSSDKDWGDNDMMDAEVQNLVDSKKGDSSLWGKYTGQALAEIVAANTPKIGYKEILKRFSTSVASTKQIATRMKPNRRFDLEAQGHKRIYTTRVLFAIDISGSMSNEDIAEGFAVVNHILKHAQIEYVTFDTEVKDVETNLKKARKNFKVTGRGGTDPKCVFDFASKGKYDGIILYSDMGFYHDVQQPRQKVLWLGHTKGTKCPVKWGYHATLNRYE